MSEVFNRNFCYFRASFERNTFTFRSRSQISRSNTKRSSKFKYMPGLSMANKPKQQLSMFFSLNRFAGNGRYLAVAIGSGSKIIYKNCSFVVLSLSYSVTRLSLGNCSNDSG